MTAMDRAKPFCIAKLDVWKAYKQVKANRGAAGVDGQSIEDFDEDLSKNLYRITTVRFAEPRFSESAGCIMDFGNSLLGRI